MPGQQADGQRHEVEVAEAQLGEERQVREVCGGRPVPSLRRQGSNEREPHQDGDRDEDPEPHKMRDIRGQLCQRHEGERRHRWVGIEPERSWREGALRLDSRIR